MPWDNLRFPLKDEDVLKKRKQKEGADSEEKMKNTEYKEKETKNSSNLENVIYVGNKPPMNYVLAAITQLNSGAQQVAIKARGRAISRAVDVAEIVRRRFVPDAQIKDVKIFTEELQNEEGGKVNVSCIEIYLARQ